MTRSSSTDGVESRASTVSTAGAPLEAWRASLIDLAFQASSALPPNPHAKTRARLQESVALRCIELDQPETALAYIEQIDGWRQGVGVAELALDRGKKGLRADAVALIDRAAAIADANAASETSQEWQRDRIRSRIAATWYTLGEPERALPFQQGIADSETGAIDAIRADKLEAADLEAALASIDAVVKQGTLDQVKSVLAVCARLFDRFYTDGPRRVLLERRVKASYEKLPLAIRIELIELLVQSAIKHGDSVQALMLVADARAIADRYTWLPEERVAILARLGSLRAAAGDREGGLADLAAARGHYESEQEKILDIYRATALREVATGLAQSGDDAGAAATWRRAVEEGTRNPNSRPRAEDFVATCLAIVRAGRAPDADLVARLHQVRAGLGAPW